MPNRINFNSEKEWLEYRKNSLGGSDLGTLFGINQYSTLAKLVLSKLEVTEEPEKLEFNPFASMGKLLEPVIFDKFVKKKFENAVHITSDNPFIYTNDNFPGAHATLDGIIENEAIIEIKFVSFYGTNKWIDKNGEIKVPEEYNLQIQQYMSIMELPKTYVFAYFQNTGECKIIEVEHDIELAEKIKTRIAQFWNEDLYKNENHIREAEIVKIDEELLAQLKSHEIDEKQAIRRYKEVEDQILNRYVVGSKLKWNNLEAEIIEKDLKNGKVKTLKMR